MKMASVVDRFSKIGASVEIQPEDRSVFTVDVTRKGRDEKFLIKVPEKHEIEVLDCVPDERLLLLMVKDLSAAQPAKHRFLCGHDERHWFAAAVPGAPTNVNTAREALKPAEVRNAQGSVRHKDRNRHRNEAFVRQGEWFFLPMPNLKVPKDMILRNEPISRGGGSKPHMVDEVYRLGGEEVLVARGYENGISKAEHSRLLAEKPALKDIYWQNRRRNATVYARGRIRHADHSTVILAFWHLVVMNTEHMSASKRNLSFID